MTKFPDLFAALAAPFETNEIKLRARSQGGRQLHYITARTAMNRLDEASSAPRTGGTSTSPASIRCSASLTLRLPDGSTVTKADAGGYAGMADQGDDDKSGFSDAFKRACVKFGVARYLYRDGVPTFVRDREPLAAEPVSEPEAPRTGPRPCTGPVAGSNPGQSNGSAPRTGKAMFAWTKEQEQRHDVGLLKYLNGWAKLQDFPGRMVEWDADQVGLAYHEACRKLQAYTQGRAEMYDEAISN